MFKKIIILFCIFICSSTSYSTAMPLQDNSNLIQIELYKMCQFKLGDTIEDLSQDNYLQKSPIQNESEALTSYSTPFKNPEINGIPLYRDIKLSFYNGQLYNAFFEFSVNNPEIGNKLKDYFTAQLGNPQITSNAYAGRTLTDYTWINGEYSISLNLGADNGALIFNSTSLSQKANKLLMIEYAHTLKTYPENRKAIEDLVRNDPEYRKSMKMNIENNPEYKEALIDAGFDMTLFN